MTRDCKYYSNMLVWESERHQRFVRYETEFSWHTITVQV